MGTDTGIEYDARNRGRKGQWGKWRGVECAQDGCSEPAKCRGLCPKHYAQRKWADGHRPPSATDTDKLRAAKRKHRYGITDDEYRRLVAAQHGACAICERAPDDPDIPKGWRGELCVDHDHATGRVRGLLCHSCNVAIGHLGSQSVALAAAAYLGLRP